MSDDEDDYMSDAFLKNCEDKRPGLLPKSIAQRYKKDKIEKIANKGSKKKSKVALETEARTEGLQTALKSDNKGYALLAKMGYKPGTALGKRGVGRTDPVPIELKSNRGGLGREADLKRKAEAWTKARASTAAKRQRMEERTRGEFMDRLNTQFSDRQSECDLHKSQNVCEQLDSQQDITEPAESFFWPRQLQPQGGDEEDDEQCDDSDEHLLSTSEKLEVLTEYLREKHIYCLWCGIKFDDFADMDANCPGDTYSAHS